jgi:hypothetical protein
MKTLTMILVLFSLIGYGQMYHTPQAKLESELNDLTLKMWILDCFSKGKVSQLPPMYNPSDADSGYYKDLRRFAGDNFDLTIYRYQHPDKCCSMDTTKIIMLICDTANGFTLETGPVFWKLGYEVSESYWVNYAGDVSLNQASSRVHWFYLGEDKKHLGQEIVVWQIKEIK